MSIFQGFFYVQLKAILTYVILQNPPNGELVHRIYLGCPLNRDTKKWHIKLAAKGVQTSRLIYLAFPALTWAFLSASSIYPFGLSILVKSGKFPPCEPF